MSVNFLNGSELAILTIVALVTIMVSSYIITYNAWMYKELLPFLNSFGEDKIKQNNEDLNEYPVWVFGYHRIGWKVCEALTKKKLNLRS